MVQGNQKRFIVLYMLLHPHRVPYGQVAAVQTIVILAANEHCDTCCGMRNRNQNSMNCCGKSQSAYSGPYGTRLNIIRAQLAAATAEIRTPCFRHPPSWTPQCKDSEKFTFFRKLYFDPIAG